MYVALENKDAVAVLATDERREVACTRAGQAPRAIVYLPGAVGSEENREPREPRWFFSLQRKATGRVGRS